MPQHNLPQWQCPQRQLKTFGTFWRKMFCSMRGMTVSTRWLARCGYWKRLGLVLPESLPAMQAPACQGAYIPGEPHQKQIHGMQLQTP